MFFMRPPFSILTLRHSPPRAAESFFCMRSVFFSDGTRIQTNEHQAHERTVYLLVDHKVTVTVLL